MESLLREDRICILKEGLICLLGPSTATFFIGSTLDLVSDLEDWLLDFGLDRLFGRIVEFFLLPSGLVLLV